MSNRYQQGTETSVDSDERTISEADIADYLKSNPDFFRNNASLLGEISLPHVSGNAVSLVERQVAVLRERSISTRRKLGELIDNARDNDELFNQTQQLVLALLRCENADALIATIEASFIRDFDVQHCGIAILTDGETTGLPIDGRHTKQLSDAQSVIANLLDESKTTCGVLRDTEAGFIFGDGNRAQSAAVTQRTLGSGPADKLQLLLAVGHDEGNHYNSDTGTLFIDYIADVLQVLLGRMLPAE